MINSEFQAPVENKICQCILFQENLYSGNNQTVVSNCKIKGIFKKLWSCRKMVIKIIRKCDLFHCVLLGLSFEVFKQCSH